MPKAPKAPFNLPQEKWEAKEDKGTVNILPLQEQEVVCYKTAQEIQGRSPCNPPLERQATLAIAHANLTGKIPS